MPPKKIASRITQTSKTKKSTASKKRRVPKLRLRLRPCVPRNCFRLLVVGVALHYVMLIGVYYGFINSHQVETTVFWNGLKEGFKKDDTVVESPTTLRKAKIGPQFLWGIDTDNSEADRRQLLRDTYIREGRLSSMICSLHDFELWLNPSTAGKENSTSLDKCRIIYVFAMAVDDPSLPITSLALDPSLVSTTIEVDEVALNLHYHPSATTPEDATRTTGKNIWWDYAAGVAERLELDYVAWVHPETLIFPSAFWDIVKDLPTRISSRTEPNDALSSAVDPILIFGETTPDHLAFSCNQCFYELDAKRLTGYMTFLSLDVLQPVVSSSCKTYSSVALKECISKQADPIDKLRSIHLGRLYREESLEAFKTVWDHYNNQVDALEKQNHGSTVYVTAKFGRHGQFSQELATIKTLLTAIGGFQPNQIVVYDTFPSYITQDVRWEPHLEFMTDATLPDTGGGYWFWKPPIIEHHLDRARMGDFVIFGDADLWDHLSWLPELLHAMKTRNANLALYHNNFPENAWTKRDVYELMCDARERYMPNDRSFQWHTGLLIVQKAPGTMELIRAWTRLVSNYHWVSDEESLLPNYPEFKEHRRDQSLLSLLLKCKYREPEKEEFDHPSIRKLGWLKAYTFLINPIMIG